MDDEAGIPQTGSTPSLIQCCGRKITAGDVFVFVYIDPETNFAAEIETIRQAMRELETELKQRT